MMSTCLLSIIYFTSFTVYLITLWQFLTGKAKIGLHVERNSCRLIRDTIHPDSCKVGLRKTTRGPSHDQVKIAR